MKQNSSSSNLVTKSDLKQELISLEKRLDDKLNERLDRFAKAFGAEMKFLTSNVVEEVRKDISKFKDQIYTTFSPLLDELEVRRQDREIGTFQISEIRQNVNQLQKRVAKLEKSKQN